MNARKLRILILTPVPPWPTHDGWTSCFYHVLVTLKDLGHEVHLLATHSDPDPDLATLRAICPTQYFETPKPPRWRQVIANIGNPIPFSVARYRNAALVDTAERWIRDKQIDVVLIEDLAMAPYGPALRDRCGVPYYIHTHNVDTQLFARFAAQQRNPPMRLAAEWQTQKMRRYEGRALTEADGFSVLSENDREALRHHIPGLAPDVIGIGTDLDRLRDTGELRKSGLVCHVGTLTAQTKLKAMDWFCRKVWPLVRQERPDAVLELVGLVPEREFRGLEGVRVVGRVDDVLPYLHRGRVFIAPQFVGSGVRLKLLDAMATGNAIVCTPVACEGIPFIDGVHALVREEPAGFAAAVCEVLENDALAARLGRNARTLVEKRQSWRAIVPSLERRLQELTEAAADRRARSHVAPAKGPGDTRKTISESARL